MPSATHEHLLSIVNTECHRFPAGSTVRILDAGCGKGALMRYLRGQLPGLRPGLHFEIYGFDVSDHGVKRDGLPDMEGVRWISSTDPWPYPGGFFQAVISNQVLEHVQDTDFFLGEVRRTLAEGGFSAHLFPLRNMIWEGHIHIPLANRFRNRDVLRSYIRVMSRLGIGRFPDHRSALGVGLAEFAEQHADYMLFFTHYLEYAETLRLAQRRQLRASFRYTREYYTRKLRSLASIPPGFEYGRRRSALADWLSVMALRYVAGITLFLERENTYRHGTEERVALKQRPPIEPLLGEVQNPP